MSEFQMGVLCGILLSWAVSLAVGIVIGRWLAASSREPERPLPGCWNAQGWGG